MRNDVGKSQEQRELMEAALLEYIEKFGLTDAARDALHALARAESLCGENVK